MPTELQYSMYGNYKQFSDPLQNEQIAIIRMKIQNITIIPEVSISFSPS